MIVNLSNRPRLGHSVRRDDYWRGFLSLLSLQSLQMGSAL